MSSILRQLPFFGEPSTVRLPDGTVVPIRADQIILWVSISLPGESDLLGARRFPAVLDTGFTHTLLIPEGQLVAWAGLRREQLARIDSFRTGGYTLPLHDADVCIHPNRRGTRDEFTGQAPFRLELADGIGIWPSTVAGARRLPLLGLRAIRHAGLRVVVDGQRRRVWLGKPWRFWPFG